MEVFNNGLLSTYSVQSPILEGNALKEAEDNISALRFLQTSLGSKT